MAILDIAATGLKIKALLIEKKIKAKDIAEKLGFASAYPVYKWMNGQTMPTLDNLVMLADLLDVKVDDVLVVKKPA